MIEIKVNSNKDDNVFDNHSHLYLNAYPVELIFLEQVISPCTYVSAKQSPTARFEPLLRMVLLQ